MSSRTVLVHAGICDATMWDAFDVPGEVLRHQLPAPLDETVAGEPAALVGASYGGLVCLDFAARSPELVTSLVLLAPPHPDHEYEWSDEVIAYAEEEERLLEAGDVDAAVELNVAFWAPSVGDRIRPMLPGALAREDDEPESVDLSAVRAPALIAVGDRDKRDFHEIAERLVRELPDARRTTIANAGHLSALEQPKAVQNLIRVHTGASPGFSP